MGVELQIYQEGELLYGRRWATRALALEEAAARMTRDVTAHQILCNRLPTLAGVAAG